MFQIEDKPQEQSTQKQIENMNQNESTNTNTNSNGNVSGVALLSAEFLQGERLATQHPAHNAHNAHNGHSHPLTLQNAI